MPARESKKALFSFAIFSALVVVVLCKVPIRAKDQTVGMRDFGNRFEGTTLQLNALSDLTFVALHRHFEPFSKNSTVSVSFFLPRLADDSKVFLEALELQDSLHYFMYSKQQLWQPGAWNTFRPWPTRDVLDPSGIASDNVGVRAAVQVGNKTRMYLPVDVYSTNPPVKQQKYTFYYVTAQDLQSVNVSVTDVKGRPVKITKDLKCNQERSRNCLLFAAGDTFNFALDFSALPEGQYYVHLVGRIPRTRITSSAITSLYHPSRSEKSH